MKREVADAKKCLAGCNWPFADADGTDMWLKTFISSDKQTLLTGD
jgi:hypothetical protein